MERSHGNQTTKSRCSAIRRRRDIPQYHTMDTVIQNLISKPMCVTIPISFGKKIKK